MLKTIWRAACCAEVPCEALWLFDAEIVVNDLEIIKFWV